MTKVKRAFASNENAQSSSALNKDSMIMPGSNKGFSSMVSSEVYSPKSTANSRIPQINKVLRKPIPNFLRLVDVFVEKWGVWKEAAIAQETQDELTVHVLYQDKEDTYTVSKKDGNCPAFIAEYGSKAFTGKNYENIAIGSYIDVNIENTWAVEKVGDIDLDRMQLKISSEKTKEWIPISAKYVLPLHHKTSEYHTDHDYRIKFINDVEQMRAATQNEVTQTRRSARIAARKSNFPQYSYRENLNKLGFDLKVMVGDGNCLFRAISHQIHGNSRYHGNIRNKCIDYLHQNKERFTPFVELGPGGFEGYLEEKRKTGVWGDHIELQALCEIYQKSLFIFSEALPDYKVKLLKTLSEDDNYGTKPFVLSFTNEHYNSIIALDHEPKQIEQISISDFYKVVKLKKLIQDGVASIVKRKVTMPSRNSSKVVNKKQKLMKSTDTRGFLISNEESRAIQKAIKLSKNDMSKGVKTSQTSSTSTKKASPRSSCEDIILQQVLADSLSNEDADADMQRVLEASLKFK